MGGVDRLIWPRKRANEHISHMSNWSFKDAAGKQSKSSWNRRRVKGRRRTRRALVFTRGALGLVAASLCRRRCCRMNACQVSERTVQPWIQPGSFLRFAPRVSCRISHVSTLRSCLTDQGGLRLSVTRSINDQSMLDPDWSGATVTDSYRHREPLFSMLVSDLWHHWTGGDSGG